MFRISLDNIPVINNIYQLTDDPDLVTSGDGDKFDKVGYHGFKGDLLITSYIK